MCCIILGRNLGYFDAISHFVAFIWTVAPPRAECLCRGYQQNGSTVQSSAFNRRRLKAVLSRDS